jgi:hypothetical protein
VKRACPFRQAGLESFCKNIRIIPGEQERQTSGKNRFVVVDNILTAYHN